MEVEFAMSVRVKKIHPALKHGGYAATALLPGEDRVAFEKLHQDMIAELRPDGPLESDIVATIVRITWRKQNLDIFRIAQSARDRYSAIRSETVPSTTPPPCPHFDKYPNRDPCQKLISVNLNRRGSIRFFLLTETDIEHDGKRFVVRSAPRSGRQSRSPRDRHRARTASRR
jgi:hypothetical protein